MLLTRDCELLQYPSSRAGRVRASSAQLGSAGRMLRALVDSHTHLLCAVHTTWSPSTACGGCPVAAAYSDAGWVRQLNQLDSACRMLKAPAHDVTHLLCYVSLNLAAIRKILKKYGKSVEASHAAHAGTHRPAACCCSVFVWRLCGGMLCARWCHPAAQHALAVEVCLSRRENPQEIWPVCGDQPCSTRWSYICGFLIR